MNSARFRSPLRLAVLSSALLGAGVVAAPIGGATPASAKDGKGNGGADYVIAGKHYLLDLAESGDYADPYFEFNHPVPATLRAVVAAKLGTKVSDRTKSLIVAKIAEIADRYPLLGQAYEFEIKASQVFTPEAGLRHPYLERSPMLYRGSALKRVAVRLGNTIYLDTSLLERLDEANQAATFVHEWSSAILNEQDDSTDTRRLVGGWFHRARSEFEIERIFGRFRLGRLTEYAPSRRYSLADPRYLRFTAAPFVVARRRAGGKETALASIDLEKPRSWPSVVAALCEKQASGDGAARYELVHEVFDFIPGETGLQDAEMAIAAYSASENGTELTRAIRKECAERLIGGLAAYARRDFRRFR